MSIAKSAKKKFLDFEFFVHRFKNSRKKNHFSNFGEQEIIEKYIEILQLNDKEKTFVDIGAGNGIRMSNTYELVQKNWNGVGIDYDSRKVSQMAYAYKFFPGVFSCRCSVTPFNIVNLLKAYSIKEDFELLSLDIDSFDYWVLDAILSVFRPRLIVSEYNEKIPPPVKFAVSYDPQFRLTHHFYGYSLAKLEELLIKHDYKLIEIEYNNVFIAPSETKGVKSMEIETAYKKGYLDRADRKEKFKPNYNMEVLHSLKPEECIKFLDDFYTVQKGNYEIGL